VPQHRRKTRRIAGFLVYAAFLVATGVWFAYFQFSHPSIEDARMSTPDGGAQRNNHTATILMRGGADGRCRQMRFDNNTGNLQQGADAACDDKALAANSTEGRMNTIRGAFSKK
jgi:hypothetical protein